MLSRDLGHSTAQGEWVASSKGPNTESDPIQASIVRLEVLHITSNLEVPGTKHEIFCMATRGSVGEPQPLPMERDPAGVALKLLSPLPPVPCLVRTELFWSHWSKV